MSFTEPAGRQGSAEFRWAQDHSEPWLAQAASIDTDVAQYFLVSARCGCFMQAARSLNVRSTLLRKQLAQLEQQLQHTLFSFQGSALSLTREGHAWLAVNADSQNVSEVQTLIELIHHTFSERQEWFQP